MTLNSSLAHLDSLKVHQLHFIQCGDERRLARERGGEGVVSQVVCPGSRAYNHVFKTCSSVVAETSWKCFVVLLKQQRYGVKFQAFSIM